MWGLLKAKVPYCGAPPSPGTLLFRWNLDPILIAALLAALALYLFANSQRSRSEGGVASWRVGAFVGGWTIGTLSLISPLCPLSVSLFGARVGQHMILALIAAPLVLLGRPGHAFAGLWPRLAAALKSDPVARAVRGAAGSTGIFAASLWFWHAPGPYDATFASPLIYWVMHLTVFGSALLVWNVLLDPRPQHAVPVMAVGAVSTLQMTFLGAIITLTPRLLYAPHILTPYAWGLTQASDQQIGGLIMWVPGCSIFLAVTLLTLGRAMSERSHLDLPA